MFLPYMGLVLLMLCIQIIAQFFHYQSSVIFPSLGCCNHKNELPNKAAATAKKTFFPHGRAVSKQIKSCRSY